MSDPTTLQELADSLTASLRYAHQRQDAAPSAGDGAYQAGYAAALADTRATVLAMIANVNRRIAANNQVIPESANALSAQALLDGRIEAYEDVRGETPAEEEAGPTWASAEEIDAGIPDDDAEDAECAECGRNDVVGQVGSLYYCTRHEAQVTAQAKDDNPEGQPLLHKAEPDLNVEHYGMCKHCGKEVKRVPGGNGPTWVHEATGMVVG